MDLNISTVCACMFARNGTNEKNTTINATATQNQGYRRHMSYHQALLPGVSDQQHSVIGTSSARTSVHMLGPAYPIAHMANTHTQAITPVPMRVRMR